MWSRLRSIKAADVAEWVAIAVVVHEVFLTPPPIDGQVAIIAGIFYGGAKIAKA